MKILLCIDDTDNLESIGTGEVLQNMCRELLINNLGEGGFISRHQLFVHEDIPYTSHNSSMCCKIELIDEKIDDMIEFSKKYLNENCAEGSDPGLCIVLIDKLDNQAVDQLIEFGKKAKIQVLTKEDAYRLAEKYSNIVFLSEHGGTGQGVIGALAGCGLRLYGNDGRMKGKVHPQDPYAVLTVGELCKQYDFACAMTLDNNIIESTQKVIAGDELKAVVINYKPTIVLFQDKDQVWRPVNKKLLKKY